MNLSRIHDSKLCASNCSSNYTNINVSQLCVTLQISFEKNAAGSFASNILIIMVNSLFSIFAAAVNLLVMIALNRKEELKTAANLVLSSMALSDFLVGLIVQPLRVVYHILDIYHVESCKIKVINSFIGISCVGASMFSVVMFAVDRCFAIMFPFRYQEHLIYKKYVAVIVCGWGFLLFSGLMTYFHAVNKSFLFGLMSIAFYCCVLSICFCYIMIYKEVRKKRQIDRILPAIPLNELAPKNIDEELKQPANITSEVTKASAVTATASSNVAKEMKQEKIKGMESSSSKQNSRLYTVVAILTVFLLCYLPVTIVRGLSQAQVIQQKAMIIAYDWTNVLVLLNSSINPLIYCIRVHQIRSEVKRLLNM